jgi:predicted nucleic acid-binding protein
LVLLEIYMQLRNPAVFAKPKTPGEAAAFCGALAANPAWEQVDYDPEIAPGLWKWAAETRGGFRQVIDARLALTLRHHGVTHFATANPGHFEHFGFEKVWNPLL